MDNKPLKMYSDSQEFLVRMGLRIKQLRIEKGLSLRDLSRISGVNNSKIAKVEKGYVNITVVTLAILLEALGVSPVVFWDFDR